MIRQQLTWFDPARIGRSGQCFRFAPLPEGGWGLTALGRHLCIRPDGDGFLFDCTPEEWETVWYPYFDLDTDYEAFAAAVNPRDAYMTAAVACAAGVRILRQDPWIALISFILSQNNNIKRITGLYHKLCRAYGREVEPGWWAFPTPQELSRATEQELKELKVGFRDKYILDAVDKSYLLDGIGELDYESAKRRLMGIKGIGEKVANCVLLFGCHRMEAFPVDVWIRKVLERYYPGRDLSYFEPYPALCQQYLFSYARNLGLD